MIKVNFYLRNVVAIAICLAGMTMFSGCDKEKKDDPDSGETPTTNVRLVKEVVFFNDEYIVEYDYDAQNRITKISGVGYGGSYMSTFSYPSVNTMFVHSSDGTETIMLNNDGSIRLNGEESYTYVNGYLQKEEWSWNPNSGYEGDIATATRTYTWENENITKYVYDLQYSVTSEYNRTWTGIHEYGELPNKATSIDFGHFLLQGDGIPYPPHGWWGKSIAKLPTKASVMGDGRLVLVSYRYETDAEGYITKVYQTWDGKAEELWISIHYK